MLVALRQAAVRRGRVDAGETDDEMFAYATVHELAESVLTPPAFYVYHTDPKARLLDALARIRDAPDQFDGASRFCQAHTPGLLAVCAPVVGYAHLASAHPFGLAPERRAGREAPAADQSTMSGTGMTQEMEALAFEGSQGFDLTDEEAEESARLYDEAQVVLHSQKKPHPPKPHDQNACSRARRRRRQRQKAWRRRQTRRTPPRTRSSMRR